MRGLIVVFIAISVLIAIIQYKSNVTFIAQLMGVSWGALAGAFLAPLLYGLYWKKTTKAAVVCSYIWGAGVMTLNLLFRSAFPLILQSPINCGAFAMLSSLLIVPLVSMITPKMDEDLVAECFACYDREVKVKATVALGDEE